MTDVPISGGPPLEGEALRELRRQRRREQVRRRRIVALAVLGVVAIGIAGLVAALSAGGRKEAAPARVKPNSPAVRHEKRSVSAVKGAVNPKVPGITTFRGNLTRTYYGAGPVPRHPEILWRYPRSGDMCAQSADEKGVTTWCGLGWTGQANVIPHKHGALELRFGAYDDHYHFLNALTGTPIKPDLVTGDLAKGSATSDPDGYPLYYAGSRDNNFRIIATDRPEPTVLWSMNAETTVPYKHWNNDWDGAALVVGDYLLEGGENSWFYVVRLHRGWTRDGKVRVRPKIVLTVPSWDDQLAADFPTDAFSIENSVAFYKGVAYFANSAGLVQGWDISNVLAGGTKARRVFRFWTGDDTDASVVIDSKGYLYVASELEKFDARSAEVGQLMRLDPRRPDRPLVWSLPAKRIGDDGSGGIWSTPALDHEMLYVATNAGGLLGVDRLTGKLRWKIPLPGPTWSSPVVVDGVLLQGDCSGVLHAYDVSKRGHRPPELWRLKLGGCIEATPAVWQGMIWVGTRAGAMYGIGEARPAPQRARAARAESA
jgi:outer membrane protein assembly factor BamB